MFQRSRRDILSNFDEVDEKDVQILTFLLNLFHNKYHPNCLSTLKIVFCLDTIYEKDGCSVL